MRLTSLWKNGRIFWRVFNWDDTADPELKIGKAEGTFGFLEVLERLQDEVFQLELRENDFGGRRILTPGPNRLFRRDENWILRASGDVTSYVPPTLRISSPNQNAQLGESRYGSEDTFSLEWAMNDLALLHPGEMRDRCRKALAKVRIKQGGYSDLVAPARYIEGESSEELARFDASKAIPHSGPAELVGLLGDVVSPMNYETAPLPVIVTPTAPRNIAVEFEGAMPGSVPPTIGVGPQQCTLVFKARTNRTEYFRYLIYRSPFHNNGEWDSMSAVPAGEHVEWTGTLEIGPNQIPGSFVLELIEEDYFGVTVPHNYAFALADVVAPTIAIDAPTEDYPYIVDRDLEAEPLVVEFYGWVGDSQSGYRPNSLEYSVGGDTKFPHVDPDGRWSFTIPITSVGPYSVSIRAADKSNNVALEVRQFEVRSSYKPGTIDDLLSTRAYLGELLSFIRSHIKVAGSTVSPELLRDSFSQQFGKLVQPHCPGAEDPVNELLTPVRLLRKEPKTIESACLIARYSFDEAQTDGAALLDRGGRFGLNGRYVGSPIASVDPAKVGAMVVDPQHYAIVAPNPLLEVGTNDSDFSVSFWIFVEDNPSGKWRFVVGKRVGSEGHRGWYGTFTIGLCSTSNCIDFRLTTGDGSAPGGTSLTAISLQRWTHVACVKAGHQWRLYVDGRPEREVVLSSDFHVIPNSAPLKIGTSNPAQEPSFVGALDELRIYATALDAEDVAQLALDRHAGLSETYVADYHQIAYETLLAGLGTSFEEIRTLRLMTPAQPESPTKTAPPTPRELLAKRVGLWIGDEGDVDRLDCLLSGTAPTVYDATADFQAIANPATVWGYGYTSLESSNYPIVWFDTASSNPPSAGQPANTWTRSDYIASGTPSIWKNTTASTLYGIAAGQISMHPGPEANSDFAVLRFTAPETNTYSVIGQFFAGDSGNMSGAILLNGDILVPLVSFASTTDQSVFQLPSLALTKGQTLDFVVGNNGDYTCGNTPIDVKITAPKVPGKDGYERWLADVFGLPLTIPENIPAPKVASPILLNLCQFALSRQWDRADAGRLVPDLDPDLVDSADLSPTALAWLDMLRARRAELKAQFKSFLSDPALAIADVLKSDQAKLAGLEAKDARGEAIDGELEQLCLDRAMFRRLRAYTLLVATATPLSTQEREDLAHLLVQIRKRRELYVKWLHEERTVGPRRLWPYHPSGDISPATEAAWVPENFKASFLPWRGSAQARSALEGRLGGRVRTWQGLSESHHQSIAEAQRVALPVLRDGLLGMADLPGALERMDGLAQRWLMDFATSGSSQTTPIDQAIACLQTLVNGVRDNWFDVGHPAKEWSALEDKFDVQWSWLDSYGRWRSAVMNYLYPENVLYPELRDGNSDPLKKFLAALGKLQPLSTTALKSAMDSTNDPLGLKAVTDATEKEYFVPVAIALAFQRAGLYAAALDWYGPKGRVYDTSQSTSANRKLAALLKPEENLPPIVSFGDTSWTLALDDPHASDSQSSGKCGCRNPYTRFTLFQILHCIVGLADDAFASGTQDGRAKALGLYIEANDILRFEELQDLQPANPATQVYLPSPVLASLRAHVSSALSKLRRGLSYLGTPMAPDLTRSSGGGAVSSLIRPTPYRYRVLMERAKQLVQQAQQLEAQYLAAMEKGDAEAEKYLSSGFAVEIAAQTQYLRRLQVTEASHGLDLAVAQQTRSQIQKDRYQQWIAAGQTANERAQVDNLWAAKTARDVIAGLDATIGAGQAASSAASFVDLISSAGVKQGIAFGLAAAAVAKGVAQGFLNDNETRSQVSGILASQERRSQEWQLQADLATQDVAIAGSQMVLANDRIDIATSEQSIADSQHDHAKQMLAFLGKKFSSVQFYQWFMGELGQIYATFLRLATANAQNAELQLAFERQEQPARLIKSDYWQLAAVSAAAAGGSADSAGKSTAIDPKGVTGSARLLQDIYTLDEHAFSSDRRVLNLTQTFSLSRQMPIEFEDFRRTGVLAFSTPMQWFDEGFPGHYMRLIKKVRVSVSALIPPSQGIRAMLTNAGLSRVVTADPGYPTMVIRQDPQMVALTSPLGSTGVFELDTQSDMLYPFEGTGVDTSWYFELPPAGNPFDFDSLVDVVLSIDYTAQFSSEVKDRVVKKLPRTLSGDRTFSIRRDFPDLWYELSNSSGTEVVVSVPLSKRNFPPGLKQLKIAEIAVSIRDTDGGLCDFLAALAMGDHSSSKTQAVRGIASSRQSGGAGWAGVISSAGEVSDKAVNWNLKISDVPNANSPTTQSILAQLRSGKIDDIVVMATFSGMRPSW